ncbi:elongation of very long chain fatty acids protein 4-like [Phlebotomus papatasi]|uniref:elongation of very long chain fatty acids protein 4-like n=1 Tax=Phlebotomus papatasi TaxID=29031 RepID=UPI002483BE5F|nr:elongation of very long chain fatty acids protein 4-like [Phlebotomus papatasi]
MHYADFRTRGWFLVDNVYVVLALVGTYLAIVALGPILMKNRQPFEFKRLILVYNITVAVLNAYICYELFLRSKLLNYTWTCSPIESDGTDPNEVRLSTAIWLYYITKYIEFLDSLFFVLRKKENQLSFLHIYHHTVIVLYSWLIVKFFSYGLQKSLFDLLAYSPVMFNSGVHVIMYIYYGLSTLGPTVAKYLWWKKYLTLVQMIQFLIGMIIAITAYFTKCAFFSSKIYLMNFFFIGGFFLLFLKFYIDSYKKPAIATKSAKVQ